MVFQRLSVASGRLLLVAIVVTFLVWGSPLLGLFPMEFRVALLALDSLGLVIVGGMLLFRGLFRLWLAWSSRRLPDHR